MLSMVNIPLTPFLESSTERLQKAMPLWKEVSSDMEAFIDRVVKSSKISRPYL